VFRLLIVHSPLLIERVAALSNICIKLTKECLAELDQPQALENEEVVHQIRVLTKRLRAAWHLVQPICGKDSSKQRCDALRKLSGQLAQSRDQFVQLALAEKFHRNHPEISKISLEILIASSPSTSPQSEQTSVTDIQQVLAAEIAAWGKIRLGDKERTTLRYRWRKSLKKVKTLTKETSSSTDPELWHNWRKAVKRLRYQREFLAMINPRLLGKKDTRIRNLGTRLGDHNDLAVFSRQLDCVKLAHDQLKALKKAVALHDQDIKRNCRRLGRKLFGR